MTSPLNENLITTKEAGELFGYTSDYISRLIRSGKITGKRIGHNWLIEKESLVQFSNTQGNHKIVRARALANERAQEYRAYRSLLHRTTKALTTPLPISQFGIGHIGHPMSKINTGESSFLSHAFALSVALLVVVSGAFAAQASTIPQFAASAVEIARTIAFGFDETFGSIPAHIIAHIDAAKNEVAKISPRIATSNEIATAKIASPILANPDLSALRMALDENQNVRIASQLGGVTSKLASSNAPIITADDVRTFALDTYATLTSPARSASALTNAYVALGENAYAGIGTAFAAYNSLIGKSAEKVLALAATTRDMFRAAPGIVANTNLALGTALIEATHAAIGAEVMVSYGLAAAAPASARATVALLGNTGNALALAAAHIPALATAAYLRTTEMPARIAPAIAQAVFDAEYAGATHFVMAANVISGAYLASLNGAGALAYESAKGARDVIGGGGPMLANAHTAMNDAYLGALGKTALAFETFARIPKVAAVLSVVRTTSAPMLAAVLPALTTGEKIALATYETLHNFFNSTSSMLAFLFGPSPTVVSPSVVPPTHIAVSTSSPQATSAPRTTTSNSYTTNVNGISQAALNQSLASLRTDILGTVAGMLQPLANPVPHFSDARSGAIFNGSTFDGGSLTNGVVVSATNGTFTNLTGGTTNLATTTITGDTTIAGNFSLSGALSSATSATAPYFVATSSTATSTFAGSLAVGTSTPFGNGLFTVGTSSPLLYISSNTGNVGIGTLASAYRLDVNGTLRSANDAYFNANTTLGSATSTNITYFNSRIADNLVPTADNVLDVGDGTNWLRWRTGYFGTSVGIGGTATSTGVSMLASGAYLIDSASTLSLNTTHNQPVSFGTGNVLLPYASSTALTLANALWVGGNATTTSNGTITTNGNLVVKGTTNDIAGTLNLSSGLLTSTGALSITSNGVGGDLTLNSGSGSIKIASGNDILATGANSDIGSSGIKFNTLWVDTIQATSLIGTVVGGATNSAYWTINFANASDDTVPMGLIFERGTVVPNATLSWNVADSAKRFEFNQPLFIQNASSTAITTLDLKGLAGQTADIFRIASSSGTTLFNVTAAGLVGIGTTSPYSMLSVAGQIVGQNFVATSTTATNTFAGAVTIGGALTVNGLCVTGDTRLRRRRKAKKGEEDEADEEGYIYDEVMIKDIEEGDEIASMDEKTGKLVWSEIKQLAFMGVKDIFKITTASGKTIRTTGNHPYYVRESSTRKQKRSYDDLSSNTRVIIDYANVKAWARNQGLFVDLRMLKSVFSACGFDDVSIYYGTDENDEKSRGFINWLSRQGYIVFTKELQRFSARLDNLLEQSVRGSISKSVLNTIRKCLKLNNAYDITITTPKANFDVEITMTIMNLLNDKALKKLILFSGDGDFAALVKYAREAGVDVSVFAGRKFLSGKLIEWASRYTVLERFAKATPGVFYTENQEVKTTRPRGGVVNCSSTILDVDALSSMFGLAVDKERIVPGEGKWKRVTALREGTMIAVVPQGGAKKGERVTWDTVVSIERLPAEDVYDIEVEGTHNFIGNDIVAHNTAFFNQASTTQLSVTNKAYFGGTATTTIDSAGNLSVAGTLGIGTTSPSALFAVQGNSYVSGTAFFGGALTATSTLTLSNFTGILSSNGASGVSARTLTGTANQISIANGDGTGGNPTFSLPSLLAFTQASTSQLSVMNKAYFGGTATSTFDSTGALTLATPLAISSGGMGTTTWLTNSIPYFNGTYFTSSNAALNFNGTTFTTTYASTTAFTNSGPTWLTGLSANSLLATDANKMLISTSSIGISSLGLALPKGNFLVGNDAGVAQATSSIFISSAGNIGIGTTSPSALLAVQGNAYVSGTSFFGGAITATSTLNLTGTAANQLRVGYDTTNYSTLNVSSAGATTLTTNGTAPNLTIALNQTGQTSLIPVMTSNTLPSGIAAADSVFSGATDAYKAFDGNTSTSWTTSGTAGAGWLSYQFTTLTTVNQYRIYPSPNTNRIPKNWTFEGWNGSSWIVLDTQTNQTSWTGWNSYPFSNTTAYIKYRINVTSVPGGADYVEIAEMQMLGGQVPFVNFANGYLGLNDTAPAARLSVVGNATIGYASGQAAPSNGLIVSGNVGIGTTSPSGKLSVTGTTAQTSPLLTVDYSASGTATSSALYINSSGNVGIGTTNPAQKLDVTVTTNGDGIVINGGVGSNGSAAPTLKFRESNTTSVYRDWALTTNGASNGSLQFTVGAAQGSDPYNATRVLSLEGNGNVLMPAGNVGIGTTNPLNKLNLSVASGDGMAIDFPNVVGNTAKLSFTVSGGTEIGTVQSVLPTGGGAELAFKTYGDAGLTEKLRIQKNGNVGIGTTAPGNVLDVRTATNGLGITAYNSSGSTAMLKLRTLNAGSTMRDWGLVTNYNTNGDLEFLVGASQGADAYGAGTVMTMLSNGNVGIGTTSPATKLEVGGNTANVTFDGYLNCTVFTTNANGLLDCTRSDERVKQNIAAIASSSALLAIDALNPVSFNWRDPSLGTTEQFGLIAQQVRNVFPNLVQTTNPTVLTPDGTLTVNYVGLVSPMISAIQELDARTRQIMGPDGVLSLVPGVESQCVTGDTKLRRRKKRADGSYEEDEIEIKKIAVGDEIQSLDERTNRVVYSRVNALIDMGEQEVYELVTKSGRHIRTTANHPYLARIAHKKA